MQYRALGSSGLKVSELSLGGWLTFGKAMDDAIAEAVIEKAFDVGINCFDTSNAYGQGACEEVWGRIFQSRKRDSYVMATKVFFPMGPGPNDKGLSRKHITEQCDASLKRLQTEYLDLYQCHRFDPETPLEETVRTMDDLVRRGKILYWGFSEWTPEQVQECLKICGDRFERPRSSQPRYSAIERTWEAQLFPLCHQAGIGQIVFSPLAQGVLTGKYRPNAAPPKDSRAADDRQNMFIKRFTENAELLEKVQRLPLLAREAGCTMSQLGLAWVLRRPEVSSAIIGASRPEQLEENSKASGLKIDPQILARMSEILA
jgi:aryl-alcohol dehydrogenase-like predicted oxidoreductase